MVSRLERLATLEGLDIAVIAIYFVIVLAVGLAVSNAPFHLLIQSHTSYLMSYNIA